MKEKDMSN